MKDFEEVLRAYLESMAEQDSLFAERYNDPNKSIEECAKYVVSEVKKRLTAGSNMVAVPDAEIYGMAVHYYQEQDLKVDNEPQAVRIASPVPTATTAAPKAKRTRKAKTETEKPKKEPEVVFGVSLFDV